MNLWVRLRAGGGHDGAAFGVVLSGYIKQKLGDKSLRLAEALLPRLAERLAERGAAAGGGSGGKKLHHSAHANPPHACMVTAAIARQSRRSTRQPATRVPPVSRTHTRRADGLAFATPQVWPFRRCRRSPCTRSRRSRPRRRRGRPTPPSTRRRSRCPRRSPSIQPSRRPTRCRSEDCPSCSPASMGSLGRRRRRC